VTFSWRNGLWTLVVFTAVLSLVAVAQRTAGEAGFAQRVVLVALSGFLVGFFLTPLARAVGGSSWRRFWILGLIIFSLVAVSNAVETALYLKGVALTAVIAGGLVESIILAAVLTRVARPDAAADQPPRVLLALGPSVAFVAVLAVLWLPVYYLFETLDTPVVRAIEHGTSAFSHPAVLPMLSLELARGAIHAAVMLAIAVLARGRTRTVWLWGALAIAILNGWLPILPDSSLAFGIRIANGFEITLSSITFAGLAAYLFGFLHARRQGSQDASVAVS
jgi:hypothetical protein